MVRRRSSTTGFQLADRLALRPAEAAAVLGISERSLRQIGPELPRIVRGGLVLYPVEALREWLRQEARAGGARIDRAVEETLGRLDDA
jgi:hypothetical protein